MLTVFLVTDTADTTDIGTLRWAIEQANSNVGADTIEFDSSFDTAQTIVLNGTQLPQLNDTVGITTITGPGRDLLTISGNDLSRVFSIGENVDLKLTGMTISHGNAGDSFTDSVGGAMSVQGNAGIAIENVRFADNSAFIGGAIGVDPGAGITIIDSMFERNNVAGVGGAIQGYGTMSVNIRDSIFDSNSSEQLGGAIYLEGTLTIADSHFTHNTADGGGAIYSWDSLFVTGSEFRENTSTSSAGAIDVTGYATIEDSSFVSNEALSGGGIFNIGHLMLTDSLFEGNTADAQGGGLVNSNQATIERTIFAGNRSEQGGGGLANHQPFAVLQVSQSTFDANISSSGGGISNGIGARLDINETTITNNSARTGAGIVNEGDAILNVSNSLIASNGFGVGNYSTGNGGGLANSSTASINNTTIAGNHAAAGGGIYHGNPDDRRVTLVLQNVTVVDNQTETSGGGLYLAAKNKFATLVNTIVGRNLSDTQPNDISGKINRKSIHNLIGAGGAERVKSGRRGNIVVSANSELGLSTLADNGGQTQTVALLSDSPAVNAGTIKKLPLTLPELDQRGADQEHSYVRIFGGFIDIGAFELQPGPFDVMMNENATLIPGTVKRR